MKSNLKKTVLALSLGLSIALPVAAENTITPQVIYAFDSAYGVFAPPVWSPQQQLIIGSTRVGGDTYTIPGWVAGMYSEPASGRAYSLSQDGSDFNSISLGGYAGSFLTSHLLSKNGDVWGGSTSAASSLIAEEALRFGSVTRITPADGSLDVTSYRPDDFSLDKSFQVRGQLTEDSAGNVYMADGYAAPATETVNKTNRLLRVKPDGNVETVIDYLQYAKPFRMQGTNLRHWLSKGNSPYAMVWSDRDDALYLVSSTSTGTAVEPHAGAPAVTCTDDAPEGFFRPDCSDGTQLKGHLIRVSGEALRGDLPVAGDAIEILFHFTDATGGEISTNDNNLTSVIENGDFLYGISTTVKDETGSGQGIWRIRKSGLAEDEAVADTFTTVHRFAPVLTADRRANQLADNDAGIVGNGLYGPIVLAADGNIYGTTQYDDRTGTNNQGNGTIYRIVTGSEADRSDDTLEQVYSFVDASTGKTPKGLSLGPIEDGKQIIIGATAAGTSTGNGGIFTFGATPLPGSLSLDASATSSQPGDAITLSWTSTNAQSCTASASADDVTDWTGELAVEGSQAITAVAGTTTYSINCEGFDGAALSDQVTISVASGSNSGSGSSDSSSGGGSGSAFGLLVLPLSLLALFGLRRRNLASMTTSHH